MKKHRNRVVATCATIAATAASIAPAFATPSSGFTREELSTGLLEEVEAKAEVRADHGDKWELRLRTKENSGFGPDRLSITDSGHSGWHTHAGITMVTVPRERSCGKMAPDRLPVENMPGRRQFHRAGQQRAPGPQHIGRDCGIYRGPDAATGYAGSHRRCAAGRMSGVLAGCWAVAFAAAQPRLSVAALVANNHGPESAPVSEPLGGNARAAPSGAGFGTGGGGRR